MKKRELDPIQDCVGLEELGCNEDVDDDEGVLVVPDEILDHEQSSSNGVTGTSHTLPLGTRQSAGFTEDDQLAVCESFRGVSTTTYSSASQITRIVTKPYPVCPRSSTTPRNRYWKVRPLSLYTFYSAIGTRFE